MFEASEGEAMVAHIRYRLLYVVLFVSILLVGVVARTASASESSHTEPHGYHTHHVSALLGAAIRDEHGAVESGFSLGLDYEYRLRRWVGVGALVEVASGDLREVLVIAPLFLHPWRNLVLAVAPGVEIRSGTSSEFLFRVGAGYRFPIGGNFAIGPEFNIDIVEGHPTYVMGLLLGIGF